MKNSGATEEIESWGARGEAGPYASWQGNANEIRGRHQECETSCLVGGAARTVLYLSHTGAVGGGAEVVLLQTMRAAQAAGWRTLVVCPPGELANRMASGADRVICLPVPMLERTVHPGRAFRQGIAWLLAGFRLTLVIWRVRPHVVHANSGVAALIACLPALLTRRRLVWQQHDIVPPRPLNRLLLGRIAGRIARCVIACSRAVAESVVALGVPADRVRVSYNCAAPQFFTPPASHEDAGLPAAAIRIGVVARLVPNKGQHVFLDAVAELRRRSLPVRGVLIGTLPRSQDTEANRRYGTSLKDRASRPDLAGHISFLGYREDIRELLHSLDILVMSSVNDPFPLAILEAFAAGVPVVASASGGHPEAVVDGETGLLFTPGDARDLARCLERLIAVPELRERLAANAREKAKREYSEHALPGKLGRLYEEVMGSFTPARVDVLVEMGGFASRRSLPLDGDDLRKREALSVLIPCFNNEDIIAGCLRSVRWADEVVVCDSFSTDRTIEIAGVYADRVIQHAYQNSASQKNWAIPQLTHDWVLIVDTDERVSPALREEIERVLESPGDRIGFQIPRANHLFGRWLRHGDEWPDYQIRLFRRDAGRYEPREVHAHVQLDGPHGTLTEPLLHYPHRSPGNLRRVLLQRYTTWEAIEKRRQGVRFRWHQPLVRAPGAFAYRYLYKEGFRDGWQGFIMAAMWTAYVFITYMKLRRLESADGAQGSITVPSVPIVRDGEASRCRATAPNQAHP